MKKILFFSRESKLYGAPSSMLILAKALRIDYVIVIVTFGDGGLVQAAQFSNIPITVLANDFFSRKTGTDLFSKVFSRIARYISVIHSFYKLLSFKPDLVYVNTIANPLPVKLAALLNMKFKTLC